MDLIKAKGIDSFISEDVATGDGATVAFVLTNIPRSASNIDVITNGLINVRTTDYTVNVGTKTITFTSAPADKTNIQFKYWRT